MKKTLSVLALSTAALAVSVHAAPETEFVASDNSMASALCVTVATGNKHQVRNAIANLKPSHMLLRNYEFAVNRISCNGEELVDFALSAGNEKIAGHLSKHRFGNINIKDIAMRYQGNVDIKK